MKNKSLRIKEKIRIIEEVDQKLNSKTSIALKYGIAKSTLSTILKNRNQITAMASDTSFNINRSRIKEASIQILKSELLYV